MQWVPKAKNENVQKRIVQLILFIVDCGCTKHMTGNLKLLCNFVEKFLGLNHNLFSVGQFCDANLEVTFRKSTCFVRDIQGNDLLTDAHVPSQQELDLLFGPLYDEFFTAEEEHLQDDEFTNPFCASVQEVAESSSHNIGNSNVPTFNQPQVSEYRWTKDHPLEQVRGNPSKPMKTRRQLTTDPEMCMFALTELVDKPFGKTVIRLKWLWKNKKDEDQTVIRNKARLVAKGYAQEEEEVYVTQPNGFVDPDHPEKVYGLKKALYGLKQAPRAWYDELSKFLTSKGFTKGLQIHQSLRGIFINQAKYALEILHKHGTEKGQSIGTPMATKSKLDIDLSGNPVDQTDYHSKIESLMYLTSSRPDIVQAGSSFGLTAFSDADHAGCIDSRKSTSKGIRFLDDKLVSWMSKKQDCNAMSQQRLNTWRYLQALPEDRFKYLVKRIGMRCLTPAELEVLAKESA
nr:hypothetical protein [Tanacetum cinerariifolium]